MLPPNIPLINSDSAKISALPRNFKARKGETWGLKKKLIVACFTKNKNISLEFVYLSLNDYVTKVENYQSFSYISLA